MVGNTLCTFQKPVLLNLSLLLFGTKKMHLNNLNCQGLHLLISFVTTEDSILISKEAYDLLERKYDRCSSHMVVSSKKAMITSFNCFTLMASHSGTLPSIKSY